VASPDLSVGAIAPSAGATIAADTAYLDALRCSNCFSVAGHLILWSRKRRSRGGRIRRREFIALVSGAAAWPFPARAQQTKVWRVGALLLGIADAESFRAELREGLRSKGYIEAQNLRLEFRSAEENPALLPKLAGELVALKVDVIVALFTPCALAAQKATRDIPIVVVAGDPVRSALVPSLAQPGGNITGISLMAVELHGKCVELLRDMLPSVQRIAGMFNAGDPSWKPIQELVQLAAKGVGMEISPSLMVREPSEIDAAFATMKKEGAEAVIVQGSLATKNVAEIALKYGLPAATVPRAFAEIGGLMSYGAAGPQVYRRSAVFVTKILQGGNPANIPVEQPTQFELVINVKTAKVLGITVPQSLLTRADIIIE
jgi:putative tryptophan/tyrosine transport system substrate-binding protein